MQYIKIIEIKSELVFGHRCLSVRLQIICSRICLRIGDQKLAQIRDKSGTPSQKRDKWASRENCDFSGTRR